MEWFTQLFSKKPSEIKNVILFGNNCTSSESLVSIKNLQVLDSSSKISHESIINAKKPDLCICVNSFSFLKKEGWEVTYLESDEVSKKIALSFAKKLKIKFKNIPIHIKGLTESDLGYQTLGRIKNIKRKLLIKPQNDETLKESFHFILSFVEGL